MLCESAQNAARNLRLASRQSEAGQGHHGVAAPVAEPVIAGDHCFLVAASDDVLVGGRGQILGKGVRNRRRCGYLQATSDLCLAKFGGLSGIASFGGGNDRCRATHVQIKTQDQRIEEVFGEIEAALPFGIVFKVPVPICQLSGPRLAL